MACLREDLENQAHRAMVVLDPPGPGADQLGRGVWQQRAHRKPANSRPAHGKDDADVPQRHFGLGRHVWIEREDFERSTTQRLQAPVPGNKVRLKGGYVIECTGGCEKDADGNVTKVLATVVPTRKAAPPGRQRQSQGRHHLGVPARCRASRSAPVRPPVHHCQPDAGGKDYLALLNPTA